jgi:L-threonylcarbamoyladenylate synthase
VRLLDATALQAALQALPATTSPAIALYARSTLAAPPTVHQHTMPADAAAAAQELFAVLRHLDAQGVQEIWIETPPDSAAWDGVRDRLQRAAAKV